MTCKYKDIFGEPNKGLHGYRFLGLAVVDIILTFLLALMVSKMVKYKIYEIFISLIILGIFMHLLFCVDTPITRFLYRFFSPYT